MPVPTKISAPKAIPKLDSTLNYIRTRRCRSGGYCFYRLEEPNCADTYFALASLDLMGYLTCDEETSLFLFSRQRSDGSYQSISQAFFSIGGLHLLEKKPSYDPEPYLWAHNCYEISLFPPGTASIFGQLYYLTHIYQWLDMSMPEEERKRLTSFILTKQREDGGFGHDRATLLETRDAVFVLSYLGEGFHIGKVERFLFSCQDGNHGLVNLPGGGASYLEHIHAGLELCHLLSVPPAYPDAIFDFLQACRRVNGGYARTTHLGIASLENTFFALSSFQLLSPFIKYLN